MKDFEFYNPVRILFGKEQLDNLSPLIAGADRIMLLYGGGSIIRNGLYERVLEQLKGRTIIEFGGIEPNPTYETCMRAVDIAKEQRVDFLLAVGGGSVIDAAKFIGVAALYPGSDPWEILSKGVVPEASLPLGTVLTLPATGTEMNKNSVISRDSSEEKFAFSSPYSFPLFSVLLPDSATTLPSRQVANGIVDAFVHVIEQYLTYPVNAPVQDRFAEALLLTLVEEGRRVYEDPLDYEAMSNLMWSASMALNGLLSCGVPGDWSVHTIGHELTAMHNIDHARTLAIVLPGIWKVLMEEKKDKLLQYGKRVWNITEGSEDERAAKAIDVTVEFFESLGVKTRLGDYGITSDTINRIAERFEQRGWTGIGDRRLVSPAIVRKVLEERL